MSATRPSGEHAGGAEPQPAGYWERFDRHTELAAAIVLSLAALLSSWAGFQASLWDGEQAAHYSLAEQTRTTAARSDTLSVETRLVDMIVFTRWADAYAQGQADLALFYRERFRPEFRPAFEAWLAAERADRTTASATPFTMPGYRLAVDAERRQLHARAEQQFAAGQAANTHSDRFTQATVVLAMALFLGGIVQAFNRPWLRVGLLAIAGLFALTGLVQIASLPPLWLD